MNLEEIKRYDDSIWLYFLKTRTIFDVDNIKAQKDWLIEQVEEFERYKRYVMYFAGKDKANDIRIAMEENELD